MSTYIIDFLLFAVLIVGMTAFLSIFTNYLGEHVFGRKTRTKFTGQSRRLQSGWNAVGGKGIYKKKSY